MKLWIPENRLNHHFQICGATRTGKSTVARDWIYQAYERHWPVVFLDMKGEYFDEYFVEGGDHLIDITDERSSRWMIGREATNAAEALTMAHSAFPDLPGDHPFYKTNVRGLFAVLQERWRLSLSEFSQLLIYPDEIDARVKGTEFAAGVLSKDATETRQNLLSTLAQMGQWLRLLPDDKGRRELCIREWAAMGPARRGSIFLRSNALTFAALRPIQSMMLDLILLGLETYPGPCLLVLDEIGQFQKCPQLVRAMSMIAGSGNPIILIYQGFSQLRGTYGVEDAATIASAPYTNVVFRTTERESARYAAAILGMEAEVWRERNSVSGHLLQSRLTERVTESEEKALEWPVLPGEIQEQEDYCGWMSQAGKIVRIKTRGLPKVVRNVRLIPRTAPALELTPPEPKPERKPYKSRYTQRILPN
jgi:hypothetical protein